MNPATIRSKSLCKISDNTISYIYKPTNQQNTYKFFYYRYSPEGSIVEYGSTLMDTHDENAMDGFPTDEDEKHIDERFETILNPINDHERELRHLAVNILTQHLSSEIIKLSGSHTPTCPAEMIVWWDEGCGELCNWCVNKDFSYDLQPRKRKVLSQCDLSNDLKKPAPNLIELMDNKAFAKEVREALWEQAQKHTNEYHCRCDESTPDESSSDEENFPKTFYKDIAPAFVHPEPVYRNPMDCILEPNTAAEKELRLFAVQALDNHLIKTAVNLQEKDLTGSMIADDLEGAIAAICDKCLWDQFYHEWYDHADSVEQYDLDRGARSLDGKIGKWKQMMRDKVFADEVRARIRSRKMVHYYTSR